MSTREQQTARYWPTTKTYEALDSTPPADYFPPQPTEPDPKEATS